MKSVTRSVTFTSPVVRSLTHLSSLLIILAVAGGRDIVAADVVMTPGSVSSLCYSPDGKLIAIAGGRTGDEFFWIWNRSNKRVERRFTDYKGAVSNVVYSPDGEYLASVADDDVVRLWKPRDAPREPLMLPLPEGTAVIQLRFSPDGYYLAALSLGGELFVWTTERWVLEAIIYINRAKLFDVAFSPDHRYMATGSPDDVLIWDTDAWALTERLVGHTSEPFAVAFSPDGRTLVSIGYDRMIRFWKKKGAGFRHYLGLHNKVPLSGAMPSGANVAIWDANGRVALYSFDAELQTEVTSPAFLVVTASRNGDLLAIGTDDKLIEETLDLPSSKPK